MKERKYYSVIDNGRDFVGVTYYSFYRANSRLNKLDAIAEYGKKHGHNSARTMCTRSVRNTYLLKDGEEMF